MVALSIIIIISPGRCTSLQGSVYLGNPLNLNAAVYLSVELCQEGYTEKWLGCLASSSSDILIPVNREYECCI